MGIYLADFRFEGAPPSWDELFARVRVRYPKRCTNATRPDPGRREHTRMSSGPGEDIDLHRRESVISFSHAPTVFPFALALHRALLDFGGREDGRVQSVFAAPPEPPLPKRIADRLREYTKLAGTEDARAFDPPLDTSDGPLLAEAFLTTSKKAEHHARCFELRVHHRVVVALHPRVENPELLKQLQAALGDLGCSPF